MSSPITLSNFNNIDFSLILNSVMQQESLPLQALQYRQTVLSAERSNYGVLATRLGALETAAVALSTPDVAASYTATVSDAAVTATPSSSSIPGRYEVVVSELARAQVTASTGTTPDANTTAVATGGTLSIGGVDVTLTGSVTLQGLATAINSTTGVPVSASVVESAPGAFRLVLSGTNTGSASAFAIVNTLTGGSGVAFGANATEATDASATINNVQITSATNTLASGIPGTTLTLREKDPTKTIVVTVAGDESQLVKNVETFVSAYNSFVAFAREQSTAAKAGQGGTIANDSVFRELKNTLRSTLSAVHGTGTYSHLSTVGIEFDRTGTLTLNKATLAAAVKADSAAVTALFSAEGTPEGAFTTLRSHVKQYTQSGGFVASAQTQRTNEVSRLDSRIFDMQARLAVRRAALQREFTAADQAMSSLKSQSGGLGSLGSSGGLFTNL